MKTSAPLRLCVRLIALSFQLSAFSFFLTGCATPPAQDHTARLIARPDFPAAAQAAPEWVRDALRTITALEAQASAHD